MYVCVCTCICELVQSHVCAYACVYVCICVWTCSLLLCICVCVCMQIVCVCMCLCACSWSMIIMYLMKSQIHRDTKTQWARLEFDSINLKKWKHFPWSGRSERGHWDVQAAQCACLHVAWALVFLSRGICWYGQTYSQRTLNLCMCL